jgi:MarR family transcriptional regulator, organic hydroperoxide resistance regulator
MKKVSPLAAAPQMATKTGRLPERSHAPAARRAPRNPGGKSNGIERVPSGSGAAPADGDDLWTLLTEFALDMRRWWISTCYSLDLTPVQGMALRTLDPDAPVAMSALADNLACDASNVTGVVDKLEARGLIARQGAENDRRVKVLAVTEKGRQVRRELLSRASKAPPELAAMPKPTRLLLAAGLRAFLARSRA